MCTLQACNIVIAGRNCLIPLSRCITQDADVQRPRASMKSALPTVSNRPFGMWHNDAAFSDRHLFPRTG